MNVNISKRGEYVTLNQSDPTNKPTNLSPKQARDLSEKLEKMAEEVEKENGTPELKVQFTQEFTIKPPDSITDKVVADEWFHDDPERILQDAIDVQQGKVEVLEING